MAREHTDPVCYLVLFRVVKTKVNGDHSVNADIRDVSFTIYSCGYSTIAGTKE